MTVVRGERHFAAPRERVFAVLLDPDVVCAAIPAIRSHRAFDRDHFEAKVKVPMPLTPNVTVKFEIVERRDAEHARLYAHGAGAEVNSTFDLADHDGGTLMHWQAEFHVAGLLDRVVGHRLDAVASGQANRTLDAVEAAL
jgi:carbon monoxide dehydrogenase subunit G